MTTKKAGAKKKTDTTATDAPTAPAETMADQVDEATREAAAMKEKIEKGDKRKGKKKVDPSPEPATDAPADDSFALANGRVVDMQSVRRAIPVYAPKARVPEDDFAAVTLLRSLVKARLDEIPPDDHLLCGDQDDPNTGCREIATADVSFCPFCGDAGPVEGELPTPGPVSNVPATATDAGLAERAAELEEAMTRVETYRRDLVANAYDLGLVLRDINTRELWKARGSTSFKDFIENELGMSRTSAYRYMALTEEYDRQTFIEIGPRKLELISGASSKEDRDAALDAAKNGATTRDVRRIVEPSADTDRATPPKADKNKPAPAKKSHEITLLAKVNGKPTVVPFRGAESGRPLKHYKPGAYGELQISDDVVVRVTVKEDKDGAMEGLAIAFVRAE